MNKENNVLENNIEEIKKDMEIVTEPEAEPRENTFIDREVLPNENSEAPDELALEGTGRRRRRKKKQTSLFSMFIEIAIPVLLAVVILQFINPTIVKENSMQPNFYENDYLLMSKQAYRSNTPERYDVVIIKSDITNDDSRLLIKRVIGLPGENIKIVGTNVYIDDQLIEEEYILSSDGWYNDVDITLGEGEYFVMGDNRAVSIDSRELGPFALESFEGKVIFRCYPFNAFGIIQ